VDSHSISALTCKCPISRTRFLLSPLNPSLSSIMFNKEREILHVILKVLQMKLFRAI
jgi:hypothetical protein